MIHHYYQALRKALEGLPSVDIDYDFNQLQQTGENTINRTPLILIKFNPITWQDLPTGIQESSDIIIDVSIITSDRYGDDRSINNSITNHQPLCDLVYQALYGKTFKLSDYILNLPTDGDAILLNNLDRVVSTHPQQINNMLVTTYRFKAYGIDCTAHIASIEAEFDIILEYAIGNSPIATQTILAIRNLSFVLAQDNTSTPVPFNPSLPLANVIFPQGASPGHTVRAKFTDGYANYTYAAGVWIFNWFEPLSEGNDAKLIHITENSNYSMTYDTSAIEGTEGKAMRIKFNDGYAVYEYSNNSWVNKWVESIAYDTRYLHVVKVTNFTSNTAVATAGITGSTGMSLRIKFANGYGTYTYTTGWQLMWFEPLLSDTRHKYFDNPDLFDPAYDVSQIPGSVGMSMRIRFRDGYANYTFDLEWNLQFFEPLRGTYWLYEDRYWETELTNPFEFANFNPDNILYETAIVDIIDAVIYYKRDYEAQAWSYMFNIPKHSLLPSYQTFMSTYQWSDKERHILMFNGNAYITIEEGKMIYLRVKGPVCDINNGNGNIYGYIDNIYIISRVVGGYAVVINEIFNGNFLNGFSYEEDGMDVYFYLNSAFTGPGQMTSQVKVEIIVNDIL